MAIGGSRRGGPEYSEGDEHENPGQPADSPRVSGVGASIPTFAAGPAKFA
jgi:hypothetical protein